MDYLHGECDELRAKRSMAQKDTKGGSRMCKSAAVS